MKITDQWIESLPDDKYGIVAYLEMERDFGIRGNAMPFIEVVAKEMGYKVVEVHLKSRDDLRGKPVIYERESTGQPYFEYDRLWWEKLVDENEDGQTLVVFNIDKAEDRIVNALKSFIENHGKKYFVCIISTDKNRDLKKTTIYHLVKPIINWEED